MKRVCGCERGGDFTKTSVCAIETAVEDAVGYYQAVADAAVVYIHNVEAGHHGPNQDRTRKALKNLHEEVAAFEQWEKDL